MTSCATCGGELPPRRRKYCSDECKVSGRKNLAVPVWESPAIFVPPYAKGTRANEVAWFAATHLVQSVDVFAGEPLILERWQLRFLSEALAQDADGTPYWDTVVLVVSRKNGKTALLAAYSLFQLFDEGSPEILMAASSDKQAGRLFDADLAYVNRSPWLSEQLHQRSYIGEIARVDGLGKIVRMASDPKSAHGYNPSLVICDELHAWITPTLKKAWAAFITGGGARQNTQIFAITTAGEALEREHGILGRLIDGNEQRGECEREPGLTISRNHVARTLVYNYSAPTTDPFDLDAIKLANPASWITLDYLKKQSESPELSEAEFLQLHGCVWAEGEDQWIKEDAWNDLLEEGVEIPAGSDIYVGVDASISEDCTAVAWAWARPDGTVVIDAHVWSARNDVAYDTLVKDGDIDPKLVEDYIADVLAAKFRVREVVYDPALFTRSAKELGKRFVVAPISQQSANMAEAYQGWFSAVYSSQRLAHAGGDTLRRHVTNAIAEMTDRGWRVRKSKQNKKIDALVAGVMAHWRAAVHGPKPSVYERRGVLEFAWEEDDDDEI